MVTLPGTNAGGYPSTVGIINFSPNCGRYRIITRRHVHHDQLWGQLRCGENGLDFLRVLKLLDELSSKDTNQQVQFAAQRSDSEEASPIPDPPSYPN